MQILHLFIIILFACVAFVKLSDWLKCFHTKKVKKGLRPYGNYVVAEKVKSNKL